LAAAIGADENAKTLGNLISPGLPKRGFWVEHCRTDLADREMISAADRPAGAAITGRGKVERTPIGSIGSIGQFPLSAVSSNRRRVTPPEHSPPPAASPLARVSL